jgi:acyl-CoA thioesterase
MSAKHAAAADGFDRATQVHDDVLGPPQAVISDKLTGFGGAHGGYVAALALRAASALVDEDRPVRSLSLRLLAPVRAGTVELHRRLERSGGTMTTVSVRIEQRGESVALADLSFGRSVQGLTHHAVTMPDVPPPEDCQPLFDKPVPDATAGLMVEHRPAGGPLPLTGGDRAELRVWMRLIENRPLDDALLCFLADSAPPGLYGALTDFVAMPSSDITMHFQPRAERLDQPWVFGIVTNRTASEGYAVEDGELWTPAGELLVHFRQQRRILLEG